MINDKFHDECGIMGAYLSSNKLNCSSYLYYGLYALQHRGQESAGISVNKEGKIQSHKDVGLVSDVFKGDVLKQLKGNIGIGHVRYSTSGEDGVTNAQPLTVNHSSGQIALAHNGNLINDGALRNMLEDSGVVFQTTIDTEVMVNILARGLRHGMIEAIQRMVEILKGAYAVVITVGDKLVGIRDPFGLRPLCLGKRDDDYFLASESCALDAIGAELVRDIEPGEIVVIDDNGLTSYGQNNWVKKKACIFEQIY
ncbi:MAG: amidophosphoribosyltransferase, partial [Eubacteriaceae bacterium]|nr:amidophosphoribosyltransferase [Eubacteriaceae bacterium]